MAWPPEYIFTTDRCLLHCARCRADLVSKQTIGRRPLLKQLPEPWMHAQTRTTPRLLERELSYGHGEGNRCRTLQGAPRGWWTATTLHEQCTPGVPDSCRRAGHPEMDLEADGCL